MYLEIVQIPFTECTRKSMGVDSDERAHYDNRIALGVSIDTEQSFPSLMRN